MEMQQERQEQEIRRKWAATGDPFCEGVGFVIEIAMTVVGIVFAVSAMWHLDNLADVAFRMVFGGVLAFVGCRLLTDRLIDHPWIKSLVSAMCEEGEGDDNVG